MSNFKFQKTILAVSATAAMAGMLVGGQAHAQVNNEKGSIEIKAYVVTTTCALSLDSTASTTAAAASKTLELGTFSTATASSIAAGSAISKPSSVVLSLKEANGTGCAVITGGTKWDVSVDLPASAISTTNLTGKHTLNNTATSNAATGVAASFTVAKNGGTAFSALIGNKTGAFGHMLSGSTTIPGLTANTDTLTLTAELYRLTTGTLAVGDYKATLPLTVVYR
jgi:hypothetical protein